MLVLPSVRRTKLASNGRVVIPADARTALGLEPGDEFEVVLSENDIRLVPIDRVVTVAQDLVAAFSRDQRSLADELIAERRSERS